jgi:hypothetical protein
MSDGNRSLFIQNLHAYLSETLGSIGEDWGVFPDESYPMGTWVRTGTIFIHQEGASTIRVEAPLVQGIEISPDILEWIASRNEKQFFGNYWANVFADDTCSIVCGVKWPWEWMDAHIAKVLIEVGSTFGETLSDVSQELIEQFDARLRWDKTGDTESMVKQAFVNIS